VPLFQSTECIAKNGFIKNLLCDSEPMYRLMGSHLILITEFDSDNVLLRQHAGFLDQRTFHLISEHRHVRVFYLDYSVISRNVGGCHM